MAIKASSSITLSSVVDVKAVYRYYLLQSSTSNKPSKPTTYPPTSSWNDTEPTYTDGSTNSLYFVDCTVFSDDTFAYSEVSLSSSYEAAKAAYNKAVNAQNGVTSLGTRVTKAEASIEQNQEAINLRATREEVTKQLSDRDPIGIATGKGVVRIDDISSVTHDTTVKLRSENVIPYPYVDTTMTLRGITFTDNGDGSITINGTATRNAQFTIASQISLDGTISYRGSGGVSDDCYISFGDEYELNEIDNGSGVTFMPSNPVDITLTIAKNATFDNVTITPQLTADISNVSVTRYGKSLLNFADAAPISNETISIEGDNVVLKNFGQYGYGITFLPDIFVIGETYTCSMESISAHDSSWGWRIGYEDGTTDIKSTLSATFTITKKVKRLNLYVAFGAMTTVQDIIITKPQVELSPVATQYEPYKESVTFTTNEQGAINGVTSTAPTITLIVNNPYITIDCEYNKNNVFGDSQGVLTQTQTSVANLSVRADGISADVKRLTDLQTDSANSLDDRLKVVEEKASVSMTEEAVNIAIEKTISENGAPKLQTKTGYSFDDDGMTVQKSSNPEMKTQITEDGMTVSKNDVPTLKADNTGVDAVNLRASTYLIVGGMSRFQTYQGDRMACFWLGN